MGAVVSLPELARDGYSDVLKSQSGWCRFGWSGRWSIPWVRHGRRRPDCTHRATPHHSMGAVLSLPELARDGYVDVLTPQGVWCRSGVSARSSRSLGNPAWPWGEPTNRVSYWSETGGPPLSSERALSALTRPLERRSDRRSVDLVGRAARSSARPKPKRYWSRTRHR